ncbi:MAG: TIGR01212 family radical SAM protein [Lachnospiraceae bacterium]
MEARYYTFSQFLKEKFGEKVYKLSLDGGFTCPNRDGKIGYGGCIFCSAGGSGDFCPSASLPLSTQIEEAKLRISTKYKGDKFIAYFQAFTNTYGPIEKMKNLFWETILRDDIIALDIATRPDCLPKEVILLLSKLNKVKPVFLELGFQSMHEKTATWMRRGYCTSVFSDAVYALQEHSIPVIAHLILGLPTESKEMAIQTVDYVNSLPIAGVKFTMLHILKNTDLGRLYEENAFPLLSMEEYIDWLICCIEHLRKDIVVHRITGDGKRDELIAPAWTLQKRFVLNSITKEMKARDSFQGKEYHNGI